MTPLDLGLAGLGFDLTKPKPSCLSLRRVSPWDKPDVIEKPLDWTATVLINRDVFPPKACR